VFHLLVAFELVARMKVHEQWRTALVSQSPWVILFGALCSLLSIAAAWMSWHFFESPILELKRCVPYGRRAGMEAPSPASDTGRAP